ncbi:MAG: hypothetical protein JWM16_6266, partial [Verrucomicrobiales bacterium]|nr:hypothetical protein [Verrucomicrobiales bacterium]
TYESSASGRLSGSEANGYSTYGQAQTAFSMTIGTYTAAPPFGGNIFSGIQVANDPSVDSFIVTSRLTGTPFNGFNPIGFLSFNDLSGGAFSDTKLSNVGDLTGWPTQPSRTTWWYLAFSSGGQPPTVSGTLTSLTLVPEPGTLPLFACSVICITLAMRRRASQATTGK